MKNFLIFIAFAVFACAAHASPAKVQFQDIKLPTQVMLEHDAWAGPALGATNVVLSQGGLNNAVATTFNTFLANPDFPRNVTIQTGGVQALVQAGNAVVNGTNIRGQVISETIAVGGGQSALLTGNKAFKTITSVVFPAAAPSVWISVGTGAKLGLRHCLDDAGKYVFSEAAGAYETTRGTAVVNASALESNTFTPNTAMDGSKVMEAFYVQNFRCY